jgi:hypothetical protein
MILEVSLLQVILTRLEAQGKHPLSARRLAWTAPSYGWELGPGTRALA